MIQLNKSGVFIILLDQPGQSDQHVAPPLGAHQLHIRQFAYP